MLTENQISIKHLFSPELLSFCQNLHPGSYYIDYTDSSHLQDEEWIQLLQIELDDTFFNLNRLEGAEFDYAAEDVHPSFALKTNVSSLFSTPLTPECLRTILDQLSQCLLRAGIIEPVMSEETLQTIIELQKSNSILIIPDTNAVANGTIHWLLRAFHDLSINLVPVTVSLVQLQEHDREIKSIAGKRKITNLRAALRSRSLVNHSFAILDFFQGNYQIQEVPPELLRYVRPSSGKRGEQDQTDVLEDRLLIESIHQVLRSTRSKSPKVVVTADVTLSRVLNAEAIPYLSLLVPVIANDFHADCIRFDPVVRAFTGSPLPFFLWTLLQVFSRVRLRKIPTQTLIEMSLYWPSKTIDDWTNHRFGLGIQTSQAEPTLPVLHSTDPTDKSIQAVTLSEPLLSPQDTEHFDSHATPNISLLPILQMASLCLDKPISTEELLQSLQKRFEFSESKLINAGEVLIQSGFIILRDSFVYATQSMSHLHNALESGDLDQLSSVLADFFEPYRQVLRILKLNAELPFEISPEIKDNWPNSSKYAYKNLRPFFVYLGQAWTLHGDTVDGSNRPSDADFVQAFDSQFHNRDLVSVEELILALAQQLKMSPWAVKRYMERLSTSSLSNTYRFETATATDIVTSDRVITGGLSAPATSPLLISSVFVGDKPVFTVARS